MWLRRNLKVARNAPCPCGSGLKYKKCHLPLEPPVSSPLPPVPVNDLAVTAFRRTFPSLRGEQILTGADGQTLLEQWQANLEQEMQHVLSAHSKLWWLYTVRSLLPSQYGTLPKFVTDDPQRLFSLYACLTLASLRYGKTDVSDVRRLDVKDSGIDRIGFTIEWEPQDLDALRTLAELAILYNCLGSSRVDMAWGRCVIVFDKGNFSSGAMSDEKSHLLRLYLNRVAMDPALSGGIGLIDYRAQLDDPLQRESEQCFIAAAPIRASRLGTQKVSDQAGFPFAAVLKNLGQSFLHLQLCSQKLKEKFGFPSNDFIRLLHAATVGMTFLDSRADAFNVSEALLLRGMMVLPKQKWFQWMGELYGQVLTRYAQASRGDEEVKALVDQFTNSFSLSDVMYETIILSDVLQNPPAFIYAFEDKIVLDWLLVPWSIEIVLRDLLVQARDLRGQVIAEPEFASVILGELSRRKTDHKLVPTPTGEQKPWKADGLMVGQIDFAVQLGPILFAVDFKSLALSPNFLRGDQRALEDRWNRIKALFKENDERGLRLAENPVGSNYQLPQDVRYVVPLLCSAWPEPVLEKSTKWFVKPGTPRVLTPIEIVNLLASLDKRTLSGFLSKLDSSWAFRVNWSA